MRVKQMNEYIIVGDTENYKDCLIVVCGADKELAETVLKRMKENPTNTEKLLIRGHTNIRIEEITPEYCWWNDILD